MSLHIETAPALRVLSVADRVDAPDLDFASPDPEKGLRELLHLHGSLIFESGNHGLVAYRPKYPHTPEQDAHMVYWAVDIRSWKRGAVEPWTSHSLEKIQRDHVFLSTYDSWIDATQRDYPNALIYAMLGSASNPPPVNHHRYNSGLMSQPRLHFHALLKPLSAHYPEERLLRVGDAGYRKAFEMQSDQAGYETLSLVKDLLTSYGVEIPIRQRIGKEHALELSRHTYGFTSLLEAFRSTYALLRHPQVVSQWDDITQQIAQLSVRFDSDPEHDVKLRQFAVAGAMLVYPTQAMRRALGAYDTAKIWSFPFAVGPFAKLVEDGIRLVRMGYGVR